MRYPNIHKGIFLSRPNRFIARVLVDGEELTVHVKNTGRCKELLIPGVTVWLVKSDNPARKTLYDLVAVEKGERLINMDSQAPNRLFEEWAVNGHYQGDLTLLRPETTWGNSRFDFYWEKGERRGCTEVKGCTLEKDGWTYFPDAPTERGVKHLEELIKVRETGLEAAVCFVIQMDRVSGFSPNDLTHPAFGEALRRASANGVEVMARTCHVTPQELWITDAVPVCL